MIDYIEFENFRNLDGKKYLVEMPLTAIVGANSSGKTKPYDQGGVLQIPRNRPFTDEKR